jgi:2-iminobutanoate/2-iminopropanoate deaminase
MTQPPQSSSVPEFAGSASLGGLTYLSGVIAAETGVVRGDIRAQTVKVLDRLRSLAEGAGTSLDRAASVSVFLRHAADFAAMNDVYRTYWSDPPARTTVVCGLRDPAALIEMSMVLVASSPRGIVHPGGWLASPSPYSYGVRCGDTLFLSGLIARRGRDNTFVRGDEASQTRTLLDAAGDILRAAGMGYEHVVSSRVYLTDASAFARVNDAYAEYFPNDPPTRATVKTALAGPEANVEVTLLALDADGKSVVGERPVPAGWTRPLPLSPAIRVGGRVFVSGMLGDTPETRGNVTAQTSLMLSRIGSTLQAAGHGWDDVREATVYVTTMANRAAVMREVAKVFPRGLPAGVIIETGLVAPDGLVEMAVTAGT